MKLQLRKGSQKDTQPRVETYRPSSGVSTTPQEHEKMVRARAEALRQLADAIGTDTVAQRIATRAVLKSAQRADRHADNVRHSPGCNAWIFGDGAEWGRCTCGANPDDLDPEYVRLRDARKVTI